VMRKTRSVAERIYPASDRDCSRVSYRTPSLSKKVLLFNSRSFSQLSKEAGLFPICFVRTPRPTQRTTVNSLKMFGEALHPAQIMVRKQWAGLGSRDIGATIP
jgi:hypothetical protein